MWSDTGAVDTTKVAVLEEALSATRGDDPGLRARLLAGLATELTFAGQKERRTRLIEEAVTLARGAWEAGRRPADAIVLARVLTNLNMVLLDPGVPGPTPRGDRRTRPAQRDLRPGAGLHDGVVRALDRDGGRRRQRLPSAAAGDAREMTDASACPACGPSPSTGGRRWRRCSASSTTPSDWPRRASSCSCRSAAPMPWCSTSAFATWRCGSGASSTS